MGPQNDCPEAAFLRVQRYDKKSEKEIFCPKNGANTRFNAIGGSRMRRVGGNFSARNFVVENKYGHFSLLNNNR